MGLNLEQHEAEAVFLLKGANPGAWNILIGLFKRKYRKEQDKCVDTRKENVEIHQGRARAFRELSKIEEEALKLQELKNQDTRGRSK